MSLLSLQIILVLKSIRQVGELVLVDERVLHGKIMGAEIALLYRHEKLVSWWKK